MMTPSMISLFLFLGLCIPIRCWFVYLAKEGTTVTQLRLMAWLSIIPAIGFVYYWWTGTRKTGLEVFGNRIWWNNIRPIHAALYAGFAWAVLVQNNRSLAWKLLATDVGVGVASAVMHHGFGVSFY